MWWLFACADPGWEEVRAACWLDEGERHPLFWSVADDAPQPMPDGCARTLGDAFEVDWEDLYTTPEEASDPANVQSAIVNALYTMVAADLGTVGELMDQADPAEILHHDETIGRLVGELGDDAPASRLYVEYFWERVKRVGYRSDTDCTMATEPGSGVAICAPFLASSSGDATRFARSGPGAVSTLVHEAVHWSSSDSGHLYDGCTRDEDEGATYGAGARWLYMWELHNGTEVATQDRTAASSVRNGTCVRIEDREGWAPCEGALEGLCTPQASETPIR